LTPEILQTAPYLLNLSRLVLNMGSRLRGRPYAKILGLKESNHEKDMDRFFAGRTVVDPVVRPVRVAAGQRRTRGRHRFITTRNHDLAKPFLT
jgi:hypothetical protein